MHLSIGFSKITVPDQCLHEGWGWGWVLYEFPDKRVINMSRGNFFFSATFTNTFPSLKLWCAKRLVSTCRTGHVFMTIQTWVIIPHKNSCFQHINNPCTDYRLSVYVESKSDPCYGGSNVWKVYLFCNADSEVQKLYVYRHRTNVCPSVRPSVHATGQERQQCRRVHTVYSNKLVSKTNSVCKSWYRRHFQRHVFKLYYQWFQHGSRKSN
jgi:hypothetical protein